MKKSTSNTAFQKLSRFTSNSPFFASLRTRLLVLVLLAILPALGLLLYNAWTAANTSTIRSVRMAASRQDNLSESTRQLLATLAQLTEVRNKSPETCRQIFTNLVALHDVYANVAACDTNGTVFASAAPLPGPPSVANKPFFQNVLATNSFAAGEYAVDATTRKTTLTFGYPVHGPNNELQAVVFASVDLFWLNQMVEILNLPPNSSMTVLDRRGITLARYPDDSYVGQPVRPRNQTRNNSTNTPSANPTNQPPQPEARRRRSSSSNQPRERTFVIPSRDGTLRLYGITRLGHSTDLPPAVVSIGIPIRAMLGSSVLFLGIVSILALTAAWVGGNIMILRRVNNLLRTAGQLSTGNLRARTQHSYGRGELGQLARAFDDMAASLELNDAERERARQELKQLNEDLERRVTERTLELKRSNQDLEQFASVASHDLQEPLRMVTNYLQLIQHRYADKLDDKANEFIGFATDGAARMQQLIKDLLAYSRVTTKQRPFEPTSCQDLLDQATSNLKLAIEESNAQITHDPLPTVYGDPVLLSQLFQNLISNGLKFHDDAPPKLHVGVKRHDNQWILQFQDNGIGMDPRDFQRIFVIFQRLHGRESYPGTGIGLALCKKIAERHGGTIRVESEPGKGTSFFVSLPANAEESSSDTQA